MGQSAPKDKTRIKKSNMMKLSLASLLLFSAVAGIQGLNVETTPAREACTSFECPNDNEEGGLFQSAPCSPEFCDCSFGVPYKLTCEDPLVFDRRHRFATGVTTCVTSAPTAV